MMHITALRTEWIENPRVGGSIPPPGTIYKRKQWFRFWFYTQCVCISKTHQTHTFCRVFRLDSEWNRCGEHCEVAVCCVGARTV